jgi:hypothetical protein
METELFDRYVREVGRRLPKKQRFDVETELHSLLMDALQDRLPEGEGEDVASKADQVAVLEELGPPAQMAARYTPPHHTVIGPRLYTIYWIVVAAVAGSLTLAFTILALLAALGQQDSLTGFALLEGWFSALVTSFGWVTLVFVALERILPESSLPSEEEEPWDPRTLPEIQDRSRIEVGGLVVEIVLTVIALLVFNLFPEWVGLNFPASVNDAPARWVSVPMLAPVFFQLYLPLINVQWLVRIALDVVLLRQGRWQFLTRLVDFVLAVYGVYIVYRMFSGPPLLTMETIASESLRGTLESILFPLLKVALGIGLFGTIVESVQKLIRVFRARTPSAYGRLAGKPLDR